MNDFTVNEIPVVGENSFAAIDLEMFGQDKERLHIPHGTFACLSISMEDGTNYLINDLKLLQPVMDVLWDVPVWVFQNATYDLIQLNALCNIQRPGVPLHTIYDTMLAEKDLYSGYYTNFSLKDMVRRYFGVVLEKDKYEDIKDRTINADILNAYAIDDAVWTRKIDEVQYTQIADDPKSKFILEHIDNPMVWVVVNLSPVKVDKVRWRELSVVNASKAKSLEAQLGVNVKSVPQVKQRLLELGINVKSTGDEILAEYAGHPFVDGVREARSYRTAVSTYGENWLENHTDENGIVRAGWNVIGAVTGRMSANNPALQTIPSRKMPVFREFFISKYGEDGVIIVADVSQQEPRITALLSKDPTLIAAFNNGEDVHSAVAKTLFGLDEIEKSDPRRKIGKEVGLGIAYGLSADGLYTNLKEKAPEIENLTVEKCQEFIDNYFKKFPAVKRMVDRLVQEGYRNEYVRTPAGRKIHINIHANGWERACMNYPHQGGGVDMLKPWTYFLLEYTRQAGIPFGLTMLIHDEVVLDVRKELLDTYLELIDKSFKDAVALAVPNSPVPFIYEVGHGDSWACKT